MAGHKERSQQELPAHPQLSASPAPDPHSQASQIPTWIMNLPHPPGSGGSSSGVGGEEGSLVATSSARMQEMPALSNHHLETPRHVQHISVTHSKPPPDFCPGFCGMMKVGRNPKVDFEELLLPLEQDPATHIPSGVHPAPSSCDY